MVNLDSVRYLIQTRISELESSSFEATRFLHFASPIGGVAINRGYGASEQAIAQQNAVQEAVDAKRRGDIETANSAYCSLLKSERYYEGEYIWGWIKIMLLGKNWKDAALLFNYFTALSARLNILKMKSGFPPTAGTGEMRLGRFDYRPAYYLRSFTNKDLATKQEVIDWIPGYGGNDAIWRGWTLSDSEYEEFLDYFYLSGTTTDAPYSWRARKGIW